MRRFPIVVVVAAAAALAVAPFGLASSGSASDPRGDLWASPSSGSAQLDIVRASFGHAKGGRLVHAVTLAGAAPNPASATVPLLYIEDPARPNGGTSYCRYFVGRHDGRLGVFTCSYADRVASATIRRTGSNTIRYEFRASAIDDPDVYDWAFVTRGTAHGAQADLDRLPNGDHVFLRHRLR